MQRKLSLSLVALTAVVTAVVAAPASAFLTRNVIEEPSATVGNASGLSLASDGDGALVYRKTVGADVKFFYSRIVDGRPGTSTQVDTGQANDSHLASVSAAKGGRLLVVWENGGKAYYSVSTGVGVALSAPQQLGAATAVSATDVALAPDGSAYAVVTDGSDVKGYHFDGSAWSDLGILDNTAGDTAGGNMGEPVVSINDGGKGAVIWSEGPGGLDEVFVRSLNDTTPSAAIALSVPSIGSIVQQPASMVRMPDVGIGNDGKVITLFSEFFLVGGVGKPRAVARTITGGTVGTATLVDGLGNAPAEGIEFPNLSVNGSGQALSAAYQGGNVFDAVGAGFDGSQWGATFELGPDDAAGVEPARVALGDGGAGAYVWSFQSGPAADNVIQARLASPTSASNDVLTFSEAGFGDASDLEVVSRGDSPVGADQIGDIAAGFKQGTRMMLALEDRPPTEPKAQGPSGKLASGTGVRFAWAASIEPWGPVTYRVELDGKIVGATADQTSLAAPDVIAAGNHTWRVIAVDREGQTAASAAAGFSVPAKGGTLTFNKKRIKFRSPTISVPVVNGTAERVTGQLVASYGSGRKKSTAGKRRFAIAAGKTATVRVRISKRSLKQLKRKRKLRIKLSTTARTTSGVKLPATATVSIKYKRKR